jgi:hypothetical protein
MTTPPPTAATPGEPGEGQQADDEQGNGDALEIHESIVGAAGRCIAADFA